MSRKEFQIKKSVPIKSKGLSRNPFGENVIINREEHYGTKDQQLIRQMKSDTSPEQQQRADSVRRVKKERVDNTARRSSQNQRASIKNERLGTKFIMITSNISGRLERQ